eukprot:Awhi_evm1s11141
MNVVSFYDIRGELPEDQIMGPVINSLIYYCQALHTVIHLLHFSFVVGMYTVSLENKAMLPFSKAYLRNIALKYGEVKSLLIRKDA